MGTGSTEGQGKKNSVLSRSCIATMQNGFSHEKCQACKEQAGLLLDCQLKQRSYIGTKNLVKTNAYSFTYISAYL